MGLYFSDPSGALRRHIPYGPFHSKDVQHEGETETLLSHLSAADLRWHEYGSQVFLLDPTLEVRTYKVIQTSMFTSDKNHTARNIRIRSFQTFSNDG